MNFVLQEILKPLFRRAGSLSAGALIGIGATHDVAAQVEVVVPAVLAVLADLVFSHINRKGRNK